MADDDDKVILAYYQGKPDSTAKLEPAPRPRPWLADTPGASAKRCLPLLMANQSGWILRSVVGVTIEWNGGNTVKDVSVEFDSKQWRGREPVDSTFGHGIVTFHVPYLFRTSPGWDLLCRGPANSPKHGISPLEGLVETDWSVATFTMNWQLTQPGLPVRFELGEPYCMLVPQPRSLFDGWQAERRPLSEAPERTREGLDAWMKGRDKLQVRTFIRTHGLDLPDDLREYELQYFRGRYPDNTLAEDHRQSVDVPRFSSET